MTAQRKRVADAAAAADAAAEAAAGASGRPQPRSLSDTKCPVCLDPIKEPACGPCGHAFCHGCIKQALSKAAKCPSCRKAMRAKQVHRIFF